MAAQTRPRQHCPELKHFPAGFTHCKQHTVVMVTSSIIMSTAVAVAAGPGNYILQTWIYLMCILECTLLLTQSHCSLGVLRTICDAAEGLKYIVLKTDPSPGPLSMIVGLLACTVCRPYWGDRWGWSRRPLVPFMSIVLARPSNGVTVWGRSRRSEPEGQRYKK